MFVLCSPSIRTALTLLNVNNLIEVENGTVSNLVVRYAFARFGGEDTNTVRAARGMTVRRLTLRPHPIEGMYEHNGLEALAGRARCCSNGEIQLTLFRCRLRDDDMYRQYRVTITPHQKSADFDVKVRVKSFHDNGAVVRNTYLPPGFGDSAFLPNGRGDPDDSRERARLVISRQGIGFL